MPKEFYDDWLSVISDEANHFLMLKSRLEQLDSFYGALPAHDELMKVVIPSFLLLKLQLTPPYLGERQNK